LRYGLAYEESLALLKVLVDQKRATPRPAEIGKSEALVLVPPSVSASLVSYAQEPTPLVARRLEIARAIEELSKQ